MTVIEDTSKNHSSFGKLGIYDTWNVIWIVGKPSIILGIVQLDFHQRRTRLSMVQQDVFPCSGVSLLDGFLESFL